MNPITLNTNVIKVIREKLPENTDIVHFLIDILPLGKEAVYRRIRGNVAFSFSEACIIAEKLGISLDYFVNPTSANNIAFELMQQQYYGQKEESYKAFKQFEQLVGYVSEDPSSKFELSHNLFPQIPAHLFYHLSKYNSFKWVYQNKGMQQIKTFKDIEYPPELYQMHKNNNLNTMNIKNTSYIWDHTIFEATVGEIKYFSNINLLDREDVAILKDELHEFLYYVENLAEKGVYPTGNKIDIYISSINSDAAYSYIEATGFQISIIGAFDLHYLISIDSRAFNKMKEKIASLKRGATLISGSGVNYRIPFFRKQHELVDSL